MALLGLVSDTHSLFDPQLENLFRGVEQILHAGDVGAPEVLEKLEAIAPVIAIKGNIDEKYPTKKLPATRRIELRGQRLLLIHDAGKPALPTPALRRLLDEEDPAIVLSGHSHQARLSQVEGRLFVNPGAAGKKRFRLERTAGLLGLEPARARIEIYSLEKPGLPLYLEGDFPLAKR